jgi:hypothetical protein
MDISWAQKGGNESSPSKLSPSPSLNLTHRINPKVDKDTKHKNP